MMTPRAALAILVLSSAALPAAVQSAMAQPLAGAEGEAMLFPADRVEVARFPMPDVSEDQIEVLITVARTQRYYAALAFAPGAGLMAEPTVMASNYHSPEAARAAALAQCNARRQGGAACVLAIEVRPAGWAPRPLSLSADATEAVGREYRGIRGPRALAIASSGGAWVIAQGDSAEAQALSACNAQTPASDCRVVLRD